MGYDLSMADRTALAEKLPGAKALNPREIPRWGWVQVTKRAWSEMKEDQVPLMAAGVAFFSFLSLFPAMIAAVMVYGLVADPQTVAQQSEQLTQALPDEAASLLTEQMRSITETSSSSLGFGLLVALALALWSASGGVNNMVLAVNLAYDEEETRSFVKRRVLSLLFTLGAIAFVLVAITLIAVAPVYLDAVVPGGFLRVMLEIARWAGLLVAVAAALGILYRFAPDRDSPRFEWVSVGALVSTAIWIVASLGFSLYVDNFGSYGETYGALAGVAVLMLWLWITAFIVLFGAEVNAEAEHQTVKDTTVGEAEPLGERGAVKADTVPDED